MNKGEGFSVKAVGPNAGDEARDSVMVGGGAGTEGRVPTPVQAGDVQRYAESRSAQLAPAHRYLGGWGNSLDVSDAFPRTPGGTVMAVIAGITRGEDAVGVVDSDGQYAGDLPTDAGMANRMTTAYQQPLNRVRRQHRTPTSREFPKPGM